MQFDGFVFAMEGCRVSPDDDDDIACSEVFPQNAKWKTGSSLNIFRDVKWMVGSKPGVLLRPCQMYFML